MSTPLFVGQVCHFVTTWSTSGIHRPAIVTNVNIDGSYDLSVFTNGSKDFPDVNDPRHLQSTLWVHNVPNDETTRPYGTCHVIEP